MKKYFSLLVVLLAIISCSSSNKPMLTIYENGMFNLKEGNYNTAAELFEKIEDVEPFSKDATNGLIMAAYSYYKAGKYEDSIRIVDYFTQSNPINENLSYMYYLKGLSYYDRISSMSKARDITEATDSTFKELLFRYPNSIYRDDVLNRLKTVETYLSGNEMSIANYYLKRGNYIGAINHYTNVLNEYPNSNFVPEALYRLIEINSILDFKIESAKYYKVLSENYKDSEWTKYSTKIVKKYEKK